MEIQPPGTDSQPSPLREVFFNDRGLRPGWRVLIAIALFWLISFVVFSVALLITRRQPRGAPPSLQFQIPGLVLQFLVVALVSWIMSRIERRNMGEYGLPLRGSGALLRFIRGCALWGFLPLTVLLLVMRLLHVFYFGSLALHGIEVWSWAAIWGVFFIFVGLNEEYSVRGYLLYTLAEGIGFWPAAIVLAALFAFLHTFNGGETRIGIIMTAFFAMFAAVTLRYTGNLWLAVGAHAGWDWGQSYFYGVNDSGLQVPGHLMNPHIQGPAWLNGGSTGPEGSILALALLLLMSVSFVIFYRRTPKPVLVVSRNL